MGSNYKAQRLFEGGDKIVRGDTACGDCSKAALTQGRHLIEKIQAAVCIFTNQWRHALATSIFLVSDATVLYVAIYTWLTFVLGLLRDPALKSSLSHEGQYSKVKMSGKDPIQYHPFCLYRSYLQNIDGLPSVMSNVTTPSTENI